MNSYLEILFKRKTGMVSKEFEKQFEEGTLIPLATYLYDAKEDRILIVCMVGRTNEETVSILKKHRCIPKGKLTTAFEDESAR